MYQFSGGYDAFPWRRPDRTRSDARAVVYRGRESPARGDGPFATHEQILQWINDYRLEPEPKKLPEALKAMSRLGLLRDQDTTGVYVGFAAGVLGSNPNMAEKLVTRMFPMPPEDQAVIVKAIAYSGLPDWKRLLGKFVERMRHARR